jgi:hypothetical protein
VQNIPVYDAVTKKGSLYKADLKAMTSATIVALLFSFGALTYYTVSHGNSSRRDPQLSEDTTDTMHRRLMSVGLTSTDGDGLDSISDVNSSLEIEGRGSFR